MQEKKKDITKDDRQECNNCKNSYCEKGVVGVYCKHSNEYIAGAVRNDCPFYICKEE